MLVELTLGNLWEDLIHWVPGALIVLVMAPQLSSVVTESVVQEHVSEVKLAENVDKVDKLHQEESVGVPIILANQLVVTHPQSDSSFVHLLLTSYHISCASGQELHATLLNKRFPVESGQIEHQSLKR